MATIAQLQAQRPTTPDFSTMNWQERQTAMNAESNREAWRNYYQSGGTYQLGDPFVDEWKSANPHQMTSPDEGGITLGNVAEQAAYGGLFMLGGSALAASGYGIGAASAGSGATAAGGGLTAEAAGSTAALSGGAGSGLGLSAETLGSTGAVTGSTAAATTMPLNTVEGYTAGTGTDIAATSGSFDWGQWAESLNNPQSLLAIGSGISGIVQGNQQQDQAALAAAAANPWGTSGGYALAGQQLQDLMKDPMQVAATDPAYQLRIQGAQRAMGAYGQDSGAMSVAGANASTDWYNQRLEQLGRLAGANLNPAQAGQLQQAGYQQGVENIGQGLGSFSYAAAPTAQTLPQG